MYKLLATICCILVCKQLLAQHVAIGLNRMNVAYAGIGNPLTIVAEHTSCENLIVTTDNGRIERTGYTECGFEYYPAHAGTAIITVNATTASGLKIQERNTYRIKNFPAPTVTVAGRTTGTISRGLLCAQIAPGAWLNGFDYQANYRIHRFMVSVLVAGDIIFERTTTDSLGARFDQETTKVFYSLTKGAQVWLSDIWCGMNGTEYKNVNDILLTIE